MIKVQTCTFILPISRERPIKSIFAQNSSEGLCFFLPPTFPARATPYKDIWIQSLYIEMYQINRFHVGQVKQEFLGAIHSASGSPIWDA